MTGKPGLSIAEFQDLIERTFGKKDRERGLSGTFMWFTEEVGELARALKRGEPDRENLREEFADVFAWLSTLASIAGIDLAEAASRYAAGCPRCKKIPCACAEATRFVPPRG
jgi:NTP pyrophosphatase (non-canonical NTP hydrolase)